jgi:hypothetical protein
MTTKQLLVSIKIDKIIYIVFLISTVLGLIAIEAMTPYMAIATISYFTMIAGLFYRKQTAIHYPLMSTSIILDLLIVLTLEINRHAVKTAVAMTLHPIQQLHILASSIAVLLYFPIVILGLLRLYAGYNSKKVRSTHKILGITAFIFRTLGFVLMFTLLKKGI